MLLLALSLTVEERRMGTAVLLALLAVLTAVSYVKVWPLFGKITDKLFGEEDPERRRILSRGRSLLGMVMLMDLLPFIPGIQALLRYGYHRTSSGVDEIIGVD